MKINRDFQPDKPFTQKEFELKEKSIRCPVCPDEDDDYNYKDDFYFLDASDFPLPNFNIIKSLDFITLTMRRIGIKELLHDNLQMEGFKRVKHHRLMKKSAYLWEDSYKRDIDTVAINVLHGLKEEYDCLPDLRVIIHDPHQPIVNFFHSFLVLHGIYYKLSEIEVTFDFYAQNPSILQGHIMSHLFLKYQKNHSFVFKTTYYTNNIRKSVKGMRLYENNDNHKPESMRLELTLKRKTIRQLGLDLPLARIDDLDLNRFFDFRELAIEPMEKYLLWESKDHIRRLNERRPAMGSMIKRMIKDWSRYNIAGQISLMKKVELLKDKLHGIRNYSRFMKPHGDLNNKFHEAIANQKFLPTNRDEF